MKKRTINETIDYIDKNIERRLNEISSTKIIGIYDKFNDTDYRTLQKDRVLNTAIERAPLKLEFVGNNNFKIVALFAIPSRVNFTDIERSCRAERIRTGYYRISKETNLDLDVKESITSLGLNSKVQKKFSNVDPIENVFSPKDVYNSFIVYAKYDGGGYRRLSGSSLMKSIAECVGYNYLAYPNTSLEKDIANFFKCSDFFKDGKIEFEVPSDCRKFIKFVCRLVNDAWRIDISKYLDWHEFMK